MFPLMVDLTDRLVVVVGGGRVGRRKVAALLSAGARVRVLCLEPRPENMLDAYVEWLCAPYTADHLDGAVLALAAALPEVNRCVLADARARHIWVMDASDPSAGDFHIPAVSRRGGLVVAVSTSGASPLLAAAIRDRLDETLDPLFAVWVALLAELRPSVLNSTTTPDRRRELFAALADEIWLARLRSVGVEAVRAEMLQRIADATAG